MCHDKILLEVSCRREERSSVTNFRANDAIIHNIVEKLQFLSSSTRAYGLRQKEKALSADIFQITNWKMSGHQTKKIIGEKTNEKRKADG